MFLRAAFLLQQRRLISQCSILFKGHSKWDNIKSTKSKQDTEKSKKISSLLEKTKAAIRDGGPDLNINSKLVLIQQEFRVNNLKLDTFKNFIEKAKTNPDMFDKAKKKP